jgi:AcrR family transcriptional regulator
MRARNSLRLQRLENGGAAPDQRLPPEVRGREKVERIIAATAELLERLPLEHVTTTLIAQRAEVAISTLYRFFPDREAIFNEIVARHIERVRAVAQQMFSPETERRQTLDFMIDLLAGFPAYEPGFLPLWIGGYLTNGRVAAWEAMREESIRASYQAVVERLGMPETPVTMARMRVIGEAVDHTLRIAFAKPAPERHFLLAEIKRMVRLAVSYLD